MASDPFLRPTLDLDRLTRAWSPVDGGERRSKKAGPGRGNRGRWRAIARVGVVPAGVGRESLMGGQPLRIAWLSCTPKGHRQRKGEATDCIIAGCGCWGNQKAREKSGECPIAAVLAGLNRCASRTGQDLSAAFASRPAALILGGWPAGGTSWGDRVMLSFDLVRAYGTP